MAEITQISTGGNNNGSTTNNSGTVGKPNTNYNGGRLPQTGTNEVLILSLAVFTLGLGVFSLIKYKRM